MRSPRHIPCHRGSLRCDDDPGSPHYRYSSYGADTPLCCASHLVEILFVTTALFEAHAIPYFICWGTQLGAVRHGGLIPWDTDVDLGVFVEDGERIRGLAPALAAHGFRVEDGPGDRLIRVYYGAVNGLHLDIEVWHREGSTFVWQDDRRRYTISASDLLPLRKYRFYDRELSGPHGMAYMLEYYGADCLEIGRKQWIGWRTLLWRPGFTRRFALARRSPAPIDLTGGQEPANPEAGWRRARGRLFHRGRLWWVRAYWASLRERLG